MKTESTFLVIGKSGTQAAVEAARLRITGYVNQICPNELGSLVRKFSNQELTLVFNDVVADRGEIIDALQEGANETPIKIVLTFVPNDLNQALEKPTLLMTGHKRDLDICNDVYALFARKKLNIQVLSKRLPPRISGGWKTWIYISPFFIDWAYQAEQVLDEYIGSEIYADSDDQSTTFPVSFFKNRFAAGLGYVKALYPTSSGDFYQPPQKKKARILFVFPERMLPLQRAYYLRAFDLLSSLTAYGFAVDVLVFGPNNKDLDEIRKCLGNVCNTPFVYHLVRGGFTKFHRVVRRTEMFARRRLKIETAPPIRFNERQMIFGSENQLQKLGNLLNDNKYTHLIVTGAWFVDSALSVLADRYKTKLICDLHDVFFVLDKDSNKNEKRFFYSAGAQREREVRAIKRCDLALAISDADHVNLAASGVKNVVTCSGTFDYAFLPIKKMSWGNINFGFIGSGNKNNERCIEVIRSDWIKNIIETGVNFKIVIAGSICKTDAARRLKNEFSDYVELAGFVDNIRSYYKDIHIVLAPIMVQGGLNFKSAEALVAGRYLITNQLGTKCLGSLPGILVTKDDGSAIPNLIRSISISDDVAMRNSIQQSALEKFGAIGGYAALNSFLENTLQ